MLDVRRVRWVLQVPDEGEDQIHSVSCGFFYHSPTELEVQDVERRGAVAEDLNQWLDGVMVVKQPEVAPRGDLLAHGHLADGRWSDDQKQPH
ncbi:hypothetical protein [Kribbella sp.]|uniref:hypothetical protein n=1 Tax=Kribbella sp. TaxID=1871183 RepID=UPI0039C9411C